MGRLIVWWVGGWRSVVGKHVIANSEALRYVGTGVRLSMMYQKWGLRGKISAPWYYAVVDSEAWVLESTSHGGSVLEGSQM